MIEAYYGKIGVAACLLAAGGMVRAQDVLSIFAQAERVRSPEADFAVDFRLDVSDPSSPWKERSASYSMIAHGRDHSLILMREPASFYPGVLLIADGTYWLLLPKSAKPFQLSARHVLHGDISNGDLARGNLLAHYRAQLDGEEEIRGDRCWRLELARTSELGIYERIRYWIAQDGYRPRKFEFYGETGALLKIAYYEDYRQGPLGSRPMRIEVENPARPSERSTLTFSNLRRIDAAGLPFTRDALPAFRDAAQAKLEADGVQAEAEDLVLRGSRAP